MWTRRVNRQANNLKDRFIFSDAKSPRQRPETAVIKRIELVNFMSHEHSVFELTEGLNVLVGPNNCGKSAVVTALQILCYNDSSRFALRHESAECNITVETVEGDVVRWCRKKSGSPWYEINGERFDRLGKNGTPDKLHEVLRMPRVQSEKDRFDVHFGEQRSPVFLLNEKPRQAADFFASSSDARHLLEMQSLHKQNIRERAGLQKRLQREAAETRADLKKLEPLDDLIAEMESCERLWQQLDDSIQTGLHLNSLVKGLQHLGHDIKIRDQKINQLDSVPSPPELVPVDELQSLIKRLRNTDSRLNSLRHKQSVLSGLANPPVIAETEDLERCIYRTVRTKFAIEQLDRQLQQLNALDEPPVPLDASTLEQTVNQLETGQGQIKKLDGQIVELEKQLDITRQQIDLWALDNPECPTCGGPVSIEQLISGGHHHAS